MPHVLPAPLPLTPTPIPIPVVGGSEPAAAAAASHAAAAAAAAAESATTESTAAAESATAAAKSAAAKSASASTRPACSPAVEPSTQPCNGAYARHLFGDAGEHSLYLHEHVESELFSRSTAPITLFQCKSCPLNCANCKSRRPQQPCPFRSCAKDGVESHVHRGTFRPEGEVVCSGEGYQGSDQCRRCQWLESSTGRDGLWRLLRLGGTARKSPLHQQAGLEEKKRAAGTLRLAPGPQKRNGLMTINDYRSLLAEDTAQRDEMERQRDEQVLDANRKARFAGRHQATAEAVSTHVAAERDCARADTEKARKEAAAAMVAAATAGVGEVAAQSAAEVAMFETEVARTSEAAARAAAKLATEQQERSEAAVRAAAKLAMEQQEAATAASALLSSKLQEAAAAEVAAREQRERSRAQHEASELQHAHAKKAAARQLAAVVERLSSSELRACGLQAELTSTLSKV